MNAFVGVWTRFRNILGENILKIYIASDLNVVNTFFQKNLQRFITYKVGYHSTQIDYLWTKRCHMDRVTICKVTPDESLAALTSSSCHGF